MMNTIPSYLLPLADRSTSAAGSRRAAPLPRQATAPRQPATQGDITTLLKAWNDGEPKALETLISQVFHDLRRIARLSMRSERLDHTLQPTALVSELYLRLAGQRKVAWETRAQFFGFAVDLMRKILVDHARRRHAEKRGRGVVRTPLEEALEVAQDLDVDLVRLDEALQELAAVDPRQKRIVELRFFAGLSVEQVVEVMGCSSATVKRDWRTAKLWLLEYLKRS